MRSFVSNNINNALHLASICLAAVLATVGHAATLTTDGSAADVQAKINAASPGDTIAIPAGSFAWSSGVTNGGKPVKISGAGVGSTTVNRAETSGHLLALSGAFELSGIRFLDPYDGSQVNFSFLVDVSPAGGIPTIHDCQFTTGYNYAVRFTSNGGVIWNCSFWTTSEMLGGISFVNTSADASEWNKADTMGMQGDPSGTLNTYVEDCKFYDTTTAVSNLDDNSRVVWRHNLMSNVQMGSHGQETSVWGARHWEIYSNTFVVSMSGTSSQGTPYPLNLNNLIGLRGGTGVITGNAMDVVPFGKDQIQFNVFNIRRATGQLPCQTAWPSAHQIGQGWSATSQAPFGNPVVTRDGVGAILDPAYVWGNTGSATTDPNYIALNEYQPDECGNGQLIANYVKAGRDYLTTAKPGYAPYTYPHPIRGGSPTPTP